MDNYRDSNKTTHRHLFNGEPLITLPNPDAHATSVRATALVFADPASIHLLEYIERIAPSDATVLIIGETGTGKELVARQVHKLSQRQTGPFIAVNCGAFSESLVESELFGHERGAFTGALNTRSGWFEAANGGTLFLDEIGDLPMSTQVKILRVLQEQEVVRVGSRTPIPIDVRLVAATNVNLAEAVQAGRFREDLYYRLNVASLDLLPLRERPGDILPLVWHFMGRYSNRLKLTDVDLSADAERTLMSYAWPGNIRELQNVIHHALLICKNGKVTAADLHLNPDFGFARNRPANVVASTPLKPLEDALLALYEQPSDNLFEMIEEAIIRTAYAYCESNQVQTGRLLGISRNILRHRLKRFGYLVAG
ncbi:MAG: sigma-54 dependent transcriptional regulator [Methylovulum sp.]|uniref:sigma-54 interaction domain-containing protein n=1 Tax=Methylovulum sp. TaxID=1916980 RepID=UPI00261C7273|nr:sigma-54 dependent transcriptional regulator [Methylovulum sp.]MDD2723815.1 sigma-54 dependent transcriptional regulator [Methylovulum sp.]MDD5123693.1 sigma-54 dependent transcriptional regulator [Methylovulum sp.]